LKPPRQRRRCAHDRHAAEHDGSRRCDRRDRPNGSQSPRPRHGGPLSLTILMIKYMIIWPDVSIGKRRKAWAARSSARSISSCGRSARLVRRREPLSDRLHRRAPWPWRGAGARRGAA
jgi:hypothetical protein